MRALPSDRKRYLLQQNNHARAASQINKAHNVSASYGPSSAASLLPKLVPQLTGDSGGLMKRFSIAGLTGWGGSPAAPVLSPTQERGFTDSARRNSTAVKESPIITSEIVEEPTPLVEQQTGGLFSNWWPSAKGKEKENAAPPTTVDDTGKSNDVVWYVEGLRTGLVSLLLSNRHKSHQLYSRTSDSRLAKHLISLRVHLSTAKLTWIERFLLEAKGMDALGALLMNLVGQGSRRRKFGETEEIVLLEIAKCLRVLLNTQV
jgi:diaphanous 1